MKDFFKTIGGCLGFILLLVGGFFLLLGIGYVLFVVKWLVYFLYFLFVFLLLIAFFSIVPAFLVYRVCLRSVDEFKKKNSIFNKYFFLSLICVAWLVAGIIFVIPSIWDGYYYEVVDSFYFPTWSNYIDSAEEYDEDVWN